MRELRDELNECAAWYFLNRQIEPDDDRDDGPPRRSEVRRWLKALHEPLACIAEQLGHPDEHAAEWIVRGYTCRSGEPEEPDELRRALEAAVGEPDGREEPDVDPDELRRALAATPDELRRAAYRRCQRRLFAADRDHVLRLERAVAVALQLIPEDRGGVLGRPSLTLLVGWLAEMYERWSGKRWSYAPQAYGKGKDPEFASPGAQWVLDAVRCIDPRQSFRTVDSAMQVFTRRR